MCERDTPWVDRMMCRCHTLRRMIKASVAGLVIAAAFWNVTALELAAVFGASVTVGLCVWRVRELGGFGLWLVRRTPPSVVRAAEPERKPEAAPEVPWYDRARIGEAQR